MNEKITKIGHICGVKIAKDQKLGKMHLTVLDFRFGAAGSFVNGAAFGMTLIIFLLYFYLLELSAKRSNFRPKAQTKGSKNVCTLIFD